MFKPWSYFKGSVVNYGIFDITEIGVLFLSNVFKNCWHFGGLVVLPCLNIAMHWFGVIIVVEIVSLTHISPNWIEKHLFHVFGLVTCKPWMEFSSSGLSGGLSRSFHTCSNSARYFSKSASVARSIKPLSGPLSRHFRAKDISNNFLPLITIHTKICKLPLKYHPQSAFYKPEKGHKENGLSDRSWSLCLCHNRHLKFALVMA